MKNFRKSKIDANQKPIVEHMRENGAKVEVLGDPVDLFVWLPRFFWGFMEVKIVGNQGAYTRPQLLWIAHTTFPVCIAHTDAEAMSFLQTGIGVSQKQKDALAGFLLRNAAIKYFRPPIIEKVLDI